MKSDTAIDVAPDPNDVDPAWDLDRTWTEDEYLKLDTNRLVEFVDGSIEVLPMPTLIHQWILLYLYKKLDAFVEASRLGVTVCAAFKVKIGENRYREPDIVFQMTRSGVPVGNEFWDGADLVIEIVSEHNRYHDLETKRREYAKAGIPEYWIVDPREETITVLALEESNGSYIVHGIFHKGQRANSRLLPGFEVDVTEALERNR